MKKVRKLKDMTINAIALVDKAANRRKFLLFKRDNEIKKDGGGESQMTVEELKQILDTIMAEIKNLNVKIDEILGEEPDPEEEEVVEEEVVNEDVMKSVKEIFSSENVEAIKSVISILEKAENQIKIDLDKKAQDERSKKYGISIKEKSNLIKSTELEKLSDEQFADPVNYNYPIDADHIEDTIKCFAKSEDQALYTAEEQKIIWNKIIDSLPEEKKDEAKKLAGIIKENKEVVEVDDETKNMLKEINGMLN